MNTPVGPAAERDAFEQWCAERGIYTERWCGMYSTQEVSLLYEGWMARAGLVEAITDSSGESIKEM